MYCLLSQMYLYIHAMMNTIEDCKNYPNLQNLGKSQTNERKIWWQ